MVASTDIKTFLTRGAERVTKWFVRTFDDVFLRAIFIIIL